MPSDHDPDSPHPQDSVLSKVDALLRRHRSGGLDATLDASPEPEIPTLTDLIEGPSGGAEAARQVPSLAPAEASSQPPEQAALAVLRPEVERIVAEALAARLPQAIREQVMPDVMAQLGEVRNQLRDAMRTTIESVVREIIEREVKRALKALLKERER